MVRGASQLLAFSPGKEQAAGVWETHNTKGHCHPRASSAKTRGFHTQLDEWPQLRSRLPFGPRSQASLQKAQGPGV